MMLLAPDMTIRAVDIDDFATVRGSANDNEFERLALTAVVAEFVAPATEAVEVRKHEP